MDKGEVIHIVKSENGEYVPKFFGVSKNEAESNRTESELEVLKFVADVLDMDPAIIDKNLEERLLRIEHSLRELADEEG